HPVDAGGRHRADRPVPEPLVLRGPDARGESRPGTERAQLAPVLGDSLGRLEPDEETGIVLGGDPHRGVALAADPDRQMLALRRLGMDPHLWDLHEASLVAEGRSRPRKPEHFDRLLETRLTVIGRVTEGAGLLEEPPRSDSELEAPVR